MKQVTITTCKATIVVVDLPEGTTGHITLKKTKKGNQLISFQIVSRVNATSRGKTSYFSSYELPEGHWEKLGSLSQVTEEQWKGIVDPIDSEDLSYGYERYMSDTDFSNADRVEACNTATESGLSLLKANGVVLENPLGEELKCDCNGDCPDHVKEECLSDYREWQQAQEQVWSNPQIFINV